MVTLTKTETQVLGKGGNKLQIQVYGQQLTQVDKFIYLGGSISTDGTEEDVNRMVGLASRRGSSYRRTRRPPPPLGRCLRKLASFAYNSKFTLIT